MVSCRSNHFFKDLDAESFSRMSVIIHISDAGIIHIPHLWVPCSLEAAKQPGGTLLTCYHHIMLLCIMSKNESCFFLLE